MTARFEGSTSPNIKFAPPPVQPKAVVDPNSIAMREALARELQQQSSGIQQIESPWQGLAQLAGAALGGYTDKKVADDKANNSQFLAEALGGAMQGDVSPEKLNQIMALDPKLGMQLYEQQQGRAKEASANAEEAAKRQEVSAALREMGATRDADAFDAGIITAEKAYEILIGSQADYRPLTPEEATTYGLPSPDGYQVNRKGNIDAIGGGNTTIQMPAGETAYDKAVGEGFGKQYLGMQEGAQKGVRTLTTLDMMSQAVEDPSFYSGTLAEPVVLGLKRAAAAIGIDPAGVTSMETFNALSKQAALDVMGGSLGSGFSNADRDFVISQVPNLGNTPEGNKQLIEIQKALARRQIEISKLADDYAKSHGGRIDGQFGQALAAWAEQNPLFADQGGIGGAGGSTTLPDPFNIRGGM